ncbi:hypothetical protein D3C72_1472850 [compost metagenome]
MTPTLSCIVVIVIENRLSVTTAAAARDVARVNTTVGAAGVIVAASTVALIAGHDEGAGQNRKT